MDCPCTPYVLVSAVCWCRMARATKSLFLNWEFLPRSSCFARSISHTRCWRVVILVRMCLIAFNRAKCPAMCETVPCRTAFNGGIPPRCIHNYFLLDTALTAGLFVGIETLPEPPAESHHSNDHHWTFHSQTITPKSSRFVTFTYVVLGREVEHSYSAHFSQINSVKVMDNSSNLA